MSAPAPATDNEGVPVPNSSQEGSAPKVGTVIIESYPGFNCSVRGTTNQDVYQRVPIALIGEGDRKIAASTFCGSGIETPMHVESSGEEEWHFTATEEARQLMMDVWYGEAEKGSFNPSKIVPPITIKIHSDDRSKIKQDFVLTIVLADEKLGTQFDEAIMTVSQWRID